MKTLTLFTHGAAKHNPGPAAIGVCVVDEQGERVLEICESIGNATNDYAQYFAVVRGFQELEQKFGAKTRNLDVALRLDSALVYSHLCAEAQITDVGLIGHFIEIYNLRVASFPHLDIKLISPEENRATCTLVQKALDV